jgi:rhodanese-related sulfurtransferase
MLEIARGDYMQLIISACLIFSISIFVAQVHATDYSPELLGQVKELRASKDECPTSIPGLTRISGVEAKKLWESGTVQFLDNRTKAQFDTESIKGSQWFFSEELLKNPDYASTLDKDKTYVLFCSGDKCWRSSATALMLSSLGFKKLLWYREGLPNWKSQGLPLQSKAGQVK